MENNNIDTKNFFEKAKDSILANKKYLIGFIFIILIVIFSIIVLDFYKNKKNEKTAEKYILAGIQLTKDNKQESKEIYKEIILSKNKFYSFLALSSIIENDLEENIDEVLNLFQIIENINYEKEQKNFLKLKKSLYLMKISKNDEANKLLNEIISSNSVWKETALSITK